MATDRTEEKVKFLEWYSDPNRVGTYQSQADKLGVHIQTINQWKKAVDEAEEIPIDKTQQVENVLYKLAMEGGVKAAELFLKLNGKLIDKVENKHLVMNIDDYDKITRTAQGKLSEFRRNLGTGSGDACVQGESRLLPGEVCEDRGLDPVQDGPVDTVALSG